MGSTSHDLDRPLTPAQAEGEPNFREFVRPLTGRLLEAMNLSKRYVEGQGDYLFYQKGDTLQRVLDLTGGYGANLLGHRNPELLEVVKRWTVNGAPSMTQGSDRSLAGELGKRISSILVRETGEGPWVTTFSNSGTEAVEAAMKHAQLHYRHRLRALGQELEKEMNQAIVAFKRRGPALQAEHLNRLRTEATRTLEHLRMPEERRSHLRLQIANSHDIETLTSRLRDVNRAQLAQRPIFLALEKAYHGKTLGALSLTHNEAFREEFFLGPTHHAQTIFLPRHSTLAAMAAVIDATQRDLLLIRMTAEGPALLTRSFSPIGAAFAEPIQGEAGVLEVPSETLASLRRISLEHDFLLVFDEIQSGTFRTGLMACGHHSGITADVYTFSKSLGGGIAKIAATTINRRKYISDFGFLHTSTFAEDDLSSAIAHKVLDLIDGVGSPLAEGMITGGYLKVRLEWLRDRYPELLAAVRGRGLLLAIEFDPKVFSDFGFEFKVICDSKMQGYLLASALLNHEHLRMNPSLSNNLTLRIQPSLYFSAVHVDELIAGLANTLQALRDGNLRYFLSAIYPGEDIRNVKTPDLTSTYTRTERPLAVFLCHMIDENHVREVTGALKRLPDEKLTEKLRQTKELAEFRIYHWQTVQDERDREMDIMLMGIPITSKDLKRTFMSQQRYQVVHKVQNAVDLAKELGASTVGLGQFTSIVSGNGLYLDPRGMNLTTGNAYTISLTVQAALRSAEDKGTDLGAATVAVIGAAGNIMSVASSIMADRVGKLILIHHSPVARSPRFQDMIQMLIEELVRSDATSKVVETITAHWAEGTDLLTFLDREEIKAVLVVTDDLRELAGADVVLSGASASGGFLTLDMFKRDAVIVDVAVPPSLRKDTLAELEERRPDLTYHLGGIAKIPHDQSIDLFLLPLGKGESYACMAETFAIGFSGRSNVLNIGDLDKAIVEEVTALANEAGFVLGKIKTSSSL